MAVIDDLQAQMTIDGLPTELAATTLVAVALCGYGVSDGGAAQHALTQTGVDVYPVTGRPSWTVVVVDGGASGPVVWLEVGAVAGLAAVSGAGFAAVDAEDRVEAAMVMLGVDAAVAAACLESLADAGYTLVAGPSAPVAASTGLTPYPRGVGGRTGSVITGVPIADVGALLITERLGEGGVLVVNSAFVPGTGAGDPLATPV